MTATHVAPPAGASQPGDTLVDRAIARYSIVTELLRVDNTLQELEHSTLSNQRLIRWYRGRRAALAKELGL